MTKVKYQNTVKSLATKRLCNNSLLSLSLFSPKTTPAYIKKNAFENKEKGHGLKYIVFLALVTNNL